MRKLCLVLVTSVVMYGCATLNQKPLDSKATNLSGTTVTYTARVKPSFAAMTAGKAAFAMIGAVAMISAGNNIISHNKVPDPADTIASGLAKELESDYGATLVMPPIGVDEDSPSQIAARTKGAARFVIDAQTINWSFGYFPTDWNHYRVIYVAKVRIIDIQKKTVVAEGFCKHIPDSNLNAPTYDELLADEAAGLKSRLNDIANECMQSMKAQMLPK